MTEYVVNIFFLLVIGYFIWRFINVKTETGILQVGKQSYSYTIGDGLISDWLIIDGKISKYNGITINLPKALPHIYLDSHRDDRLSGPRFYIPRKHKVSLEGNFDDYFQLYAAEGYKQLALSIITPDVMQTLMQTADKYDIEIKGLSLRLISQKPLTRKPARHEAIIKAAESVMSEVAHRLGSWSEANSKHAFETVMPVKHEQTIKVGRHAVRSAWVLGAFCSFLFTSSWLLAANGYNNGPAGKPQPMSPGIFWLGLIICFGLPFALVKLIEMQQAAKRRYVQEKIAETIKILKDAG